jgi:hypothetical protein
MRTEITENVDKNLLNVDKKDWPTLGSLSKVNEELVDLLDFLDGEKAKQYKDKLKQ